MEAVHRYEGTVNQVLGDGIMAPFGAAIAHEDYALRACYAAVAMQGAVKQYAAGMQRTRGAPIQIKVGFNSGEEALTWIPGCLRRMGLMAPGTMREDGTRAGRGQAQGEKHGYCRWRTWRHGARDTGSRAVVSGVANPADCAGTGVGACRAPGGGPSTPPYLSLRLIS